MLKIIYWLEKKVKKFNLTGIFFHFFVHPFQELNGHTDNVNSIAFQPDIEEKYLISTSDDFTCKIWSTEDGKLLKTISLLSPGV